MTEAAKTETGAASGAKKAGSRARQKFVAFLNAQEALPPPVGYSAGLPDFGDEYRQSVYPDLDVCFASMHMASVYLEEAHVLAAALAGIFAGALEAETATPEDFSGMSLEHVTFIAERLRDVVGAAQSTVGP